MRYINGTRLDDRIIRTDWDAGFSEGRQYGRGKTGGQVCIFSNVINFEENCEMHTQNSLEKQSFLLHSKIHINCSRFAMSTELTMTVAEEDLAKTRSQSR
jgi:hypothetical protein